MNYYLRFFIGGLLILWATGCDSPSSSPDSGEAALNSLTITPSFIQFDEQSVIGDTTITVDLRVSTIVESTSDLLFTVERSGLLSSEGTLQKESDTLYSGTFNTTVNTSGNFNYTIYIYQADNSSGQRLQGQFRVRGRTVSPPTIIEVNNTEEATIPQSGNTRIDFFAKVVHPDGQELIDRVNFFLIDQTGSQLGNNFQMFDDGVFNEVEGFIDEAEGDSLYSRAFFINPGNSPDEITVNYFAVGADGQSSDTLQTSLSIVE